MAYGGGTESRVVSAEGNLPMTGGTGLVGQQSVVKQKAAFTVKLRLLGFDNRHQGGRIASANGNRNIVAGIAVEANRTAICAHMIIVMATETPRKLLMTAIVREGFPGDARFFEYELYNELPGQLFGLIDSLRLAGCRRIAGCVP